MVTDGRTVPTGTEMGNLGYEETGCGTGGKGHSVRAVHDQIGLFLGSRIVVACERQGRVLRCQLVWVSLITHVTWRRSCSTPSRRIRPTSVFHVQHQLRHYIRDGILLRETLVQWGYGKGPGPARTGTVTERKERGICHRESSLYDKAYAEGDVASS